MTDAPTGTATDPSSAPTTGSGSLAPPNLDQHKDTLAGHLSAVLQIRGYALAVENTVLTQISDPPPDWWDQVTGSLATAQTHTKTWTETLEPAITSTIPQSVIAMGSKFTTAADDILSILAASPVPSPDQQATILSDLQWMSEHLAKSLDDISTLSQTFTTFQSDSGKDFTALSAGNASIQQAILSDTNVITRLNGDIASAQADIAADKAAMTAAGIAGGVGLFVGVGVMGLGAAGTGPLAPVAIAVGALIMVGSIVEMAAVIGVYAKKLADAQTRLNDDQAELTAEGQQVASLTLVSNTVDGLVEQNKAMGQSLSEIADWWAGTKAKLDTVIDDVQNAHDDIGFWHPFKLDVTTAKADWQDFAAFATNMQDMATGAPVQKVDVAKPAQTA